MRKLTGADSRHQKALKSHLATVGMAPYITARCRLQPRWLPVVVLPVKSRGCGGDDGEWWQSLYYGFDGFRGILYEHIA